MLVEAGLVELPLTYRTLMNTNKNVPTVQFNDETEIYYYDVKEAIVTHLLKFPPQEVLSLGEIRMQLHYDGLPLYKSSSKTLWPLLTSFCDLSPKVIFPLNLTVCGSKPKDISYLSATIDELAQVIQDGITVHGVNIPLNIVMIVADAPARSLAKLIKGHTGYFSCGRCKERGTWVNNRMVFLKYEDLEERTDVEFRNRTHEEHHLPVALHGLSPFLPLPVDMVLGFAQDYMHCVCLGTSFCIFKTLFHFNCFSYKWNNFIWICSYCLFFYSSTISFSWAVFYFLNPEIIVIILYPNFSICFQK